MNKPHLPTNGVADMGRVVTGGRKSAVKGKGRQHGTRQSRAADEGVACRERGRQQSGDNISSVTWAWRGGGLIRRSTGERLHCCGRYGQDQADEHVQVNHLVTIGDSSHLDRIIMSAWWEDY